MSYIQQNFSTIQPTSLILTSRLYQIWLWRNITSLWYLTKHPLISKSLLPNLLLTSLYKIFFKEGITTRLKYMNTKNFLYYEMNLTKSLKYWNLVSANNLTQNIWTTSLKFTTNSNLVVNQYFLPLPVINIQLSKTYYRKLLFRFMESLLTNYYHPNKHYTNKMFSPINNHWTLFKYYNRYFFKIYNF